MANTTVSAPSTTTTTKENAVTEAQETVVIDGIDIDQIAANLEKGVEFKRAGLLEVFRWSEAQRAAGVTEAVRLERFKSVCETLKASDSTFLPYNTNLPFVAQAVDTWADAHDGEPSFADLKTAASLVGRATWQTKYVNVSRQKALNVFKKGAPEEELSGEIETLCPVREVNADDLCKTLGGKNALPAVLEFINNGGKVAEVSDKLEEKHANNILAAIAFLESQDYVVTKKAKVTSP